MSCSRKEVPLVLLPEIHSGPAVNRFDEVFAAEQASENALFHARLQHEETGFGWDSGGPGKLRFDATL
jgi:hypothetical protein